MPEPVKDRWAEWVLRRQHGGGDIKHTSKSEFLRSVRDRVLDNASISEGEILLDVGTGDGLIAFGALDRLGENGRVIFSDLSQDLLEHCRMLTAETNVLSRCRFVRTSADNLEKLEDSSVDVVTVRSVLIYVEDKCRAFEEFYRVLRSGGRLSIFEPINSFSHPEPPDRFQGYDVTPVRELASKVKAVFQRIQPSEDPMLDFDERKLLALAEEARFNEVRMDYRVEIVKGNPSGLDPRGWERFLASAGNPKIPTNSETIQEALTLEEQDRFFSHLRPLVESDRRRGRAASTYLWATKV